MKNTCMEKHGYFLAACAFFVLALPQAFAEEQGHMTLLAVSESANGYVGGTADLYLTIKPGSGRIFLETYPFTKVDTQMSTRFANEIACNYLDLDCSQYDFFYTLTAKSSIIAGPSAGAAIATLTVAMLRGDEVDEGVAVSGTINSGGLIGPVGGLKEKVAAGSNAGLLKILIPKGESLFTNETVKKSLESAAKGKAEIIEVYTLEEAVYQFTGKKIDRTLAIKINDQYSSTMRVLAEELCQRTDTLEQENGFGFSGSVGGGMGKNMSGGIAFAKNLSGKGEEALLEGRHYSAASYCFGANVEYTKISLIAKNPAKGERALLMENISIDIGSFEEAIEARPIRTITDLESYMITKERIEEARNYLKDGANASDAQSQLENAAWASERLNSAKSWSQFFGKPGRQYEFDLDSLSAICTIKIAEAEERIQYLELFVPMPLETVRKELNQAQEQSEKKNYELCLYKASKAKAGVGVVLGVFGVEQNNFKEVLGVKLEIVRQMIADESSKGVFPILGYSYYEYAESLKESDVLSALLYAEYALELGNLDMYFGQQGKGTAKQKKSIDPKLLLVFALGVLVGVGSVIAVRKRREKNLTSKGKKGKLRK